MRSCRSSWQLRKCHQIIRPLAQQARIVPNSSSYQNGTLSFLNESDTKSADEAKRRFMHIDKDNLPSAIIMAGIALLLVLIIIFLLICCIWYLYAKLPIVLKLLVMTVKAKLIWS